MGMGGAALAAAVPYPGKVTPIFHKGQWNTENKKQKTKTKKQQQKNTK